jgi:transposase
MNPSHTFTTKEDAMKQYVGLDVSQAETAVCVIDETGQTRWAGTCHSTPDAIGRTLRQRAPEAATIAMETGPLAVWHWHALRDAGFPVVCLHARQAHAALSLKLNKTDRNDALGLAQLVRTGWYRAVEVKSLESHTLRLLLATRTQLVSTRATLSNQIRGLPKTFGIVLGKGKGRTFERLVTAGVQGVEHVRLAINSLLVLWQHVTQEIKKFDREITAVTRRIPACQHVMTVPGVGPVTALAYTATVDNPARFKRSTDVGAYLGLTPRRYQSGDVDCAGAVSKCGDRLTRSLVFEAAGTLLFRNKQPSALRDWGLRLVRRIGRKKACVAVARKLAVLLHRLWVNDTTFRLEVAT